MIVQHITLTDRTGNRSTFLASRDDLLEALLELTDEPEGYVRIAFGGHSGLGKGGITLHFDGSLPRVNGYKIDPFPACLEEFQTVLLHEALSGLGLAAEEKAVLIGTTEYGIALRWDGERLEAFGAGPDTDSTPLPAHT
jgi:hypothetical protein